MADDTWIYWTVFAAYLAFLMIAGFRSKRKTHSLSDYLVAGRSIGPILMGLSFGVTYFSASLLIGSGQYAFNWGLSTVWIGVANAVVGIGMFLMFYGNRTRSLARELDCLTVPELIGKRYQSKNLQMFAGGVTFVFEIIYLVAVYMGLSILFTVIMPGVENAYIIAVAICGIITIIYLTIGGSHGAILTDVFESIIMLIGVIIIFAIGLAAVGGFPGLNQTLVDQNPDLAVFPGQGGFTVIGLMLVSSVGIWGSPQMISRHFTAKNKKSMRWGLVISLAWGLLIAPLAYLNANIANAYFFENPTGDLMPGNANVIPLFMLEVLEPWVAALFIACVTAASLTTGEKIVLVSTSAISRDLFQVKTGANDEKTMRLTKIATIIVVVASIGIAMLQPAAILAVTFFAFSSMASVILAPYIYGLFWKGGTKKAALITGIVCLIINVFWWFALSGSSQKLLAGVFPLFPDISAIVLMTDPILITVGSINEFIPAQIVAFIIFPIISKFTKKPDRELVERIFKNINNTGSEQKENK